MMTNQFILDYIRQNGGSIKEHHLLSYIESEHPEFFSNLGESPTLYKKHFLLFHHLYQINEVLSKEQLRLIISALDIRLLPIGEAGQSIGGVDGLKDFYLNIDNLFKSEEEIIIMQRQFWQKYLAIDKKAKAIKIMQLDKEPEINLQKIKKRFNELARKYHPDKGGDKEAFIQIKQAYDDLKLLF